VSLEEEVLAEIKPTPAEKERVRQVAQELMESLREEARKRRIPAEPVLVGSVAKDTYLKRPEIDVFVAFPRDTPREDLERWGLELGEVLEDPQRRYAEHPYTRGVFQGYDADVVPCYRLEEPSERMTAVDRTPFHLRYVREMLKEDQKDEVRLLKRFMKGVGVYGAEARVQGFSGYLCELLILRYGTFRDVLRAAKAWRPPVRLRLEAEARREFEEPLVFVDPVDGERNAASAVSLESLSTFIYAAREYLRNPDRVFFFPEEPRPRKAEDLIQDMKRRGSAFLAVVSRIPDLPEDVLYPQLRKAEQATATLLEDHDFRVFRSRSYIAKGEWLLLVEMEVHRLPDVRKHLGPPPWLKNADSFTEKWRASEDRVAGPYVEDGRLVVEIRRRDVDAARLVRDKISALSLGKHLDEAVQAGYRVLQGEDIIKAGYEKVLTDFLNRDPPWSVRGSR
jgi:tRNA nucleotidyltransferase (CCA-adding enzyme)